jgi:hypothetical protein
MTPKGLGIKVFRVDLVPTRVNQIEPGRKQQGDDPPGLDFTRPVEKRVNSKTRGTDLGSDKISNGAGCQNSGYHPGRMLICESS